MLKPKIVLSIKNLSKKLGNREVLKNVNLDLERGDIIGITGKNGSGKTTLLRIIIGLFYPSSGDVIIEGKKLTPGLLGNLPTNVSALIENPTFLPEFTGFQNLKILASIRNKISDEDIKNTMDLVGLSPSNRKNVSKYSLGMKQRLGIAQAIMEKPGLILFDEPTNALDSDGVKIFNDIVHNMSKNGTSFIMVSHKKEDIYTLCNKVYKIENGELNIIHNQKEWRIVVDDLVDLENLLRLYPKGNVMKRINGHPSVIYKNDWENSAQIHEVLNKNKINTISIE
ncbi:ATP-binding cassette domain-containing protein [Clostridium rectalis]|uniref:ATP-binding cassette domain-containing protein n=1 Tax=Clostridium rectalis TaxID=2040295 RepID=UPI000F63C369|nr:ABC transporter ATP-binding protein [Clostridium rectalis]